MGTSRRILISVGIIILAVVTILVIDSFRRGGGLYRALHEGKEKFTAACVPVYTGADRPAQFCEKDAALLIKQSFVDKDENKPQEGWLLRDVVLLSVKKESLKPETRVLVASSSRNKKAELAWKDVSDVSNMVILAPTKQGSLKLASAMKGLDTREHWVQDVDRIEIVRQ